MKKVATNRRHGNGSTVGAARIDPHAAPGSKAKALPRGSNGRTDWLTIREKCGEWDVIRVHVEGELGLVVVTTLVAHVRLDEAVHEVFAWSEGMDIPVETSDVTGALLARSREIDLMTSTYDPAGDPGHL